MGFGEIGPAVAGNDQSALGQLIADHRSLPKDEARIISANRSRCRAARSALNISMSMISPSVCQGQVSRIYVSRSTCPSWSRPRERSTPPALFRPGLRATDRAACSLPAGLSGRYAVRRRVRLGSRRNRAASAERRRSLQRSAWQSHPRRHAPRLSARLP